jgi:hypothetical protein
LLRYGVLLSTAFIALVAFGLIAAAVSPEGKMDCARAYNDFQDKLASGKYANISSEQRAALSRRALRVYNACQTGDLEDAKALFQRLDAGRY